MIRRFFAGLFLALFCFPSFSQQLEHMPASCGVVGVTLEAWGAAKIAPFKASPIASQSYWLIEPRYWQATPGVSTLYCDASLQKMSYSSPNGVQGFSDYAVCDGAQGWVVNKQSGDCTRPAQVCQPGSLFTREFGVGWSASQTSPPTSGPLPPNSYCDGSCLAILDELESTSVADTPNQDGWYEHFAVARYGRTGQTCTEQTPDPDNPAPAGTPGTGDGDGDGGGDPPSCADGNPDCDPTDGGDGGDPTDPDPGNGGTGGDGDGTGDGTGDGSGGGSSTTGTSDGNCTAEPNDPDCAGPNGGGGSGTEEGSGECGVSGKPPCSVRVDETGTRTTLPVTQAQVDAAFQSHEANVNQHAGKVNGDADKGFLEPLRDLFFVPNAATCQAFNLPSINGVTGLQIDPCPVVDGLRLVASLFWYGTALFMCLGMIRRAF